MNKVLYCLCVICFTKIIHSKTHYALQINRKMRAEAVAITAQYQPRLVMGVDQALAFQSTVANYLVKKKAVEKDPALSPMARYELLKRLSLEETPAMATVLESYRRQEYIRIKPKIQPLYVPERQMPDIHATAHTDNQW